MVLTKLLLSLSLQNSVLYSSPPGHYLQPRVGKNCFRQVCISLLLLSINCFFNMFFIFNFFPIFYYRIDNAFCRTQLCQSRRFFYFFQDFANFFQFFFLNILRVPAIKGTVVAFNFQIFWISISKFFYLPSLTNYLKKMFLTVGALVSVSK